MILIKKIKKHILKKLILTSLIVTVLLVSSLFSKAAFAKDENEIILDPSYKELHMGDEFKVDVLISTKSKLIGADVKMTFDPTILQVKGIDNGKAFKLVPLKMVKEGTILITGLAEGTNRFSGKATLATIRFKAKDAGDTKLKIAFSPPSTTNSNLTMDKANDILTKVTSAHFVIGTPVQRTGAGLKKSALQIILFLIILALIGALIFLYLRWRKYQEEVQDINIPTIPLDRPPSP